MSQKVPDIATVLRQHGLSVTKQRRYVFDLLLDSPEPVTMHQLYERANNEVDRASLYRTIAIFEELGIASRINFGWKYKIELSDMFAEHHHHLTCLNCQKIIAINEADLENTIGQLTVSHGFRATDHQVEIQGYCQDCQK